MGISLSIRHPVDRIIWAHTPSSMFTTSSAYKFLVSYESVSNAGSSNLEVQRKFWKSIWQLWVSHKIKHFVWRACYNALPTMVNLHQCHIVSTVSYKLCNDHPEDTLHVVWFCKDIIGVWTSLEWFHQSVPSPPACFSDLLSRFLYCRDEFRAEIFLIAVWLIWNRCNALHFGDLPFRCPAFAVKQAAFCSMAMPRAAQGVPRNTLT